jgi:hypothetical protein
LPRSPNIGAARQQPPYQHFVAGPGDAGRLTLNDAYSGISIRRLRKNVFECRAGLMMRLLFRHNAGTLEFFFAGSHHEVRRIIQDL